MAQFLNLSSEGNILFVRLHNPPRNTLHKALLEELYALFQAQASYRCLVLSAEGKIFCAGADLQWMQSAMHLSKEENEKDAALLTNLLQSIKHYPCPVIAYAYGAVYGGGIGLLSACDYVIADHYTQFCFSEPKLGLIPACIAPFVLSKIGFSAGRSLFLTAKNFSAARALEIELIHDIAQNQREADVKIQKIIDSILLCSASALQEIKALFNHCEAKSGLHDQTLYQHVANLLATLRVSSSAQYGMRCFLEKKQPQWDI